MSRKCCKRFEDVPKTDSKLVSKKNQTVRCPKIDAQDFTLVKKIMISHAHKVIEDPNVKENIKFSTQNIRSIIQSKTLKTHK